MGVLGGLKFTPVDGLHRVVRRRFGGCVLAVAFVGLRFGGWHCGDGPIMGVRGMAARRA
jgi:hypothetical protein